MTATTAAPLAGSRPAGPRHVALIMDGNGRITAATLRPQVTIIAGDAALAALLESDAR